MARRLSPVRLPAPPPAASIPAVEARWYAYVLVSYGVGAKTRTGAKPRARAAAITRTYVGVAVDVARRVRQHNGELAGGARSTRAGRPWQVAVIHGPFPDRGSAQAVEYQLKQRRGAAARLRPLPALARRGASKRRATRDPGSARSRTGC